ncbi:hypothetical protein ACT4US_31230, partial [Bacillus sp. HC-Mk]
MPMLRAVRIMLDSSGNIIWSAVSASKMPRVVGFFDVPANYDLQNNTFSITPGFNPWILVNNCPGNLSDDGETVGYSGLSLSGDVRVLINCETREVN